MVTGRAGQSEISPKTADKAHKAPRNPEPDQAQTPDAQRGKRPKNRLSNMTNVTSCDKNPKLYTETLDRLDLIDYHIDIEQTKGKHQPNRCRKRKNDMKDTNSKDSTTADPKERIEFKVNRYQVAWEETPVTSWEEMTKAEAQAKAQEIANKYQRVIRWNVTGSYQGHYVHPNTTKETKEEAKDIMKQTPKPETDYNGWKNRSTWNVSLWLNNDEGLYNAARRAKANGCNTYAKVIRRLGLAHDKTPDGIAWISNRLDYSELDAMIDEL